MVANNELIHLRVCCFNVRMGKPGIHCKWKFHLGLYGPNPIFDVRDDSPRTRKWNHPGQFPEKGVAPPGHPIQTMEGSDYDINTFPASVTLLHMSSAGKIPSKVQYQGQGSFGCISVVPALSSWKLHSSILWTMHGRRVLYKVFKSHLS